LESTRETTIESAIRKGFTVGCKFNGGVGRSAGRLTVHHSCPGKKIEDILPLREKETRGVTMNGNA
jgi:hypothetical protein